MSQLTILLAVLDGFKCSSICEAIETVSDESLHKIFEKTIEEMNKRKEKRAE